EPVAELLLVELVVLVYVEVADALVLGLLGRRRIKRGAFEEGELDVLRVAAEPERPLVPAGPVEGLVPLHGFLHAREGAFDERVEPLADRALPSGHRRNVGLHRLVALALWDLR